MIFSIFCLFILFPINSLQQDQVDSSVEKKLVSTRRAVITKLDHCTEWRHTIDKAEKESIEKLLMGGNFEECRDLVLKMAKTRFPDSEACIKSVSFLIKKYRRVLGEKVRTLSFDKNRIDDFLTADQLAKLHDLLKTTNRPDLVTKALNRYFGDLPEKRRVQLIKEFFAYKIDLRRRPRSVSEVEEQEEPTADEPQKLEDSWLKWQTPRHKNGLLRLKNAGASQWDMMHLIADQFYHLRKSIRKKYEPMFLEYCNKNLRERIGDKSFAQIEKMYHDSEPIEHLSTKFHQIIADLSNEADRLTADHYGQFCRKIYRLVPFEVTDLTAWLNNQQKLALAKLIQNTDVKDSQVYDKLYEFFTTATGDQKEEADELITSGCRKFIAHLFGDQVSEDIEDMRLAGNETSQAMAAYLSSRTSELPKKANKKRVEESLSICKRIYLDYDGSCSCNGKSETCDPHTHYCSNCTEHATGVQCERCEDGYEKNSLGDCFIVEVEMASCECHGHANACTMEKCIDCKNHTTGDRCENCIPGYYGDATKGNKDDCVACPCPQGGECAINDEGLVQCTKCPDGFGGITCDTPIETEKNAETATTKTAKTSEVPSEVDKVVKTVEEGF